VLLSPAVFLLFLLFIGYLCATFSFFWMLDCNKLRDCRTRYFLNGASFFTLNQCFCFLVSMLRYQDGVRAFLNCASCMAHICLDRARFLLCRVPLDRMQGLPSRRPRPLSFPSTSCEERLSQVTAGFSFFLRGAGPLILFKPAHAIEMTMPGKPH